MEELPKFERQDSPPAPQLTVHLVEQIIRSRRSEDSPGKDVIDSLEVEGQAASQPKFLGSGGSKEVFDIEVGGEHYAVALCGLHDMPERIIQKWGNILKEPVNTASLRERGFYVNELCEVKNIKVNGLEFPALMMKRFEDHPFKIYDSKNIGKTADEITNG